PKMTMKFQAATDVWREWQKPRGLIYELLSPVRRNDATAAKLVSAEVARLRNGRELDDEIDTTYRSKHRRGESIQGAALAQIHQRVSEACSYAERWLELVESRPLQNEFRDKTLASLQRDMRRIRQRLYTELSIVQLRSEPRFMEAASFARIWFDDLYRLF